MFWVYLIHRSETTFRYFKDNAEELVITQTNMLKIHLVLCTFFLFKCY